MLAKIHNKLNNIKYYSANINNMKQTFCRKVLDSGIRCKNKAKYGDYCGFHRYKGPPLLLELPDDAIYSILKYISNPKDFINFAQMSPRILFFTSCRIQNIIKYELPLINPRYYDYLLFLAIGGLYTKFELDMYTKKFEVNNKTVHVHISSRWKNNKLTKTNSDGSARPSNNLFVLNISVVDIKPTTSLYSIVETTNFDIIERFFWENCICISANYNFDTEH